MVKKADCIPIYECKDGTVIYTTKGKLSKWDYRVGFLGNGLKGTPRFAKHSHVIVDLYIKYFHDKALTLELKKYFLNLLDKVQAIDYYPPKVSFFKPDYCEIFSKLKNIGIFSPEALMVYVELLMTQEKTNYPPMTFNRKLFNDFLVKSIYSVFNTATHVGKK